MAAKLSPQEQTDSIARTVRRQMAYYDRLRTQPAMLGLRRGEPLHAAVERAWEAVYALGLALDFHKLQGEVIDAEEVDAAADHAPPPEICGECEREIGAKEVAHVFDDRCVCMACYCSLKAARDRAELNQIMVSRPPTDQQLAYARQLGLRVPAEVTYQRLADLIKTYLTRPAPADVRHQAVVMGIGGGEEMPWRALDRELDDRHRLLCWVYSVCRHMLGAEWRAYADSRLPHNVVLPIVLALAARPDDLDAVRQFPGPDEGGNDGEAAAGGLQQPWYTFANGDAETPVYLETRQRIERELWAYLPHLPRRVSPG